MSKLRYQLMPLVFVVLVAGVSLVYLARQETPTETRVFAEPSSTSVPPTLNPPGQIKTDVMDSPDGTKTLTMNHQQTSERMRYSFYTASKPDEADRQLIFSQEFNTAQALSIPYNTWSPDNKYLFLRESSAAKENFYVFSATGKKFAADAQFLDTQALFAEKVEGYTIQDVTGWAAPELLLVNAQATEDGQKVSFWFDVTSQSFIRLSTYFF